MLIIPPLHSVTSPTVGVGYLKASLQSAGLPCPTRDLNIELYQYLRSTGLSQEWLHWLFPFGERRYGAELLLSQICFDRSTDDILDAVSRVVTPSFRHFLGGLFLEEWLARADADRVRPRIAEFLYRKVSELADRVGDWLGISVVVTNLPATIWIVRELRQRRPRLRLILGGPHFHRENAAAWMSALPEIDAVIIGDARRALAEWIRNERQSTPGLLLERNGSTAIRHQPDRDRLPEDAPADWSDFDLSAYESSIVAPGIEGVSAGPVIPVHGAVGCSYNKCTFCYEVLLTPRYMPRPAKAVVDEVVYQRSQHGTNRFFFTDLDFNGDYDRTLGLCDELCQRAPSIRFACWLRAHQLDRRMLEALYSAGCRQFFIGLEAVTDRLLGLMEKGYNGEHARAVAGTLYDFGISHPDAVYAFNLITNYPGETLDDVRETLAAVQAQPELFDRHVAALFEFTLTANTVAWRRRAQLGIDQVEGFGQVLFPADLRATIPSHRYWYTDHSADYATRTLLWDVLRSALGHSPRYLRLV